MSRDCRALVTGAAGFIGGHLARGLAADGYAVTTLDIEPLEAATSKARGITEITGDISDADVVASAVADVDVVFHQAAIASVPASFDDPALCIRVNTEGSANLFEQARLAGVKRVVMASTSAIYGDDPTPVKHEGLAPKPQSPYAVSKLAMEQMADVYARQYGMEMVALRYFNVYGPGQPAEGGYAAVIPAIRKAIQTGQPFKVFGDGEQTRSFIHIDDIVRANKLASTIKIAESDPLLIANLAGSEVASLNTLIQMFAEITDKEILVDFQPEREGDIKHSAGDISVAKEQLNFTAEVLLHDGLKQLVSDTDLNIAHH